ncbi:YifB family Mg chelatase-like AAA ATPase [Actinoalloteichus hymeniacidonis]|uniref:Mg chelatase-related protein n=1 Tax=Actinoalloteichus hymeniacidonis TaxID=340345 RepID=A0AAC9HNG9_9PSEU|nr:YifB family Mg chelatase-like AAA ATPase [Actinoalloteichus hymeniacidonis]AOS62584.1 Mg chelatase-related protein [Actinoalloteichus hymeniacidonis]MBB5909385.1 magnesium chelatase family protein [Actinoalloteichus hymeniacidonis]
MGIATGWGVALVGVDGVLIEIEADVGAGVPDVKLIGRPDAVVNESKDRIKAALRNSGESWPRSRVTLGMSPAGLQKCGAGYDLALACVVLAAAGVVPGLRLPGMLLLGELALDGRLRAVRGVLPALLAARKAGLREAIVPVEALAEAALVEGVAARGARRLIDVIRWLRGESDDLTTTPEAAALPPGDRQTGDLSDVVGQPEARWALEVAAAGGHHLLLVGPPGTGKTMLAQRLAGLLPELSREEAIEVAMIQSVAGLLAPESPLTRFPPFVAPHHSISLPALIGGGTGIARPGAVSCAHRGVLLADEACEFGAKHLDALRTALEEGEVRIARSQGVARFPARCQLVLATNPCPCAPPRDRDCVCSAVHRRRYFGRLSGPLLDRVDLRVRMRPVTALTVRTGCEPESTQVVRERVGSARQRAAQRWAEYGWRCNAEVPGPALRRDFPLHTEALAILDRALAVGAMTARGADRCIRVAWTLSDLEDVDRPTPAHVSAALQFRDRLAI